MVNKIFAKNIKSPESLKWVITSAELGQHTPPRGAETSSILYKKQEDHRGPVSLPWDTIANYMGMAAILTFKS